MLFSRLRNLRIIYSRPQQKNGTGGRRPLLALPGVLRGEGRTPEATYTVRAPGDIVEIRATDERARLAWPPPPAEIGT